MTTTRRLLLALLLITAAFGLRAPFLQRAIWNVDEGITATAAEQILAGGVLYRDAADQRNPLVPYLKAGIFAVCGEWNTTAVHVVLAVLLGLGAVALWQLARRLGHDRAGLAAAAVFTVLCFMLPERSDAMAAHTEWFLIVFSIAGFLAFAAATERPGFRRGLGVGLLFGLAVLCKQPGLFDWAVSLVLVGLLLLARPAQRAALLRLALGNVLGLALALGLTLAYFAHRGALSDLIYYAWTYNNRVYVPAIPLLERLLTMREPFLLAANYLPEVLVLGLLGALALLAAAAGGLRRRPVEIPLLPWLALGWTASGILATGLSGRGFSHYSIQVIPGLSLGCGWFLVEGWDRAAALGRFWRLAAATALALAVVDTGARIVARSRQLTPSDDPAYEPFQVVQRHTRPEERIFVWGFMPEDYVFARRRPATRFIYTTFLTGMIPWANLDPLIDTSAIVTPGSWAQLQEDFQHTPPAMIIDTGAVRGQGKYPLHDQPWLWSLITRDYAEIHLTPGQFCAFRLYRRLAPVAPEPLPAAAAVDNAVKLTLGYTGHVQSLPLLALTAPAGASRVDLFVNGRLFRSLPLPDGQTNIAFFVPPAELPAATNVFTAVVHYPAGLRLSPPLPLSLDEVAQHRHSAPGPAILFLGREIRPLGSETSVGPPTRRGLSPETWLTHATAKLIYARPAGLRSFTLNFGLDPEVYYDRPDRKASDGVDFVVDYAGDDGTTGRLFTRRLYPKTNQPDCGPQTAEIDLPNSGSGRIILRVLPGPVNEEQFDWAYLGNMTATDYGPTLTCGEQTLPAERVSSNHAPVMTADPEGRWIAHSPSSLSYALPPGVRSLTFSYGLEPASYDGSQSGRTDGIDVTVTDNKPDGTSAILFQRTLDPANVAADRGRQTSRIELQETQDRRVTIAIGPGPNNNVSFDWSYLAALQAASADTPAPVRPAAAAPVR